LQSLSQGKSAQSQSQAALRFTVATKTLNTPEIPGSVSPTLKICEGQSELVQIFNEALSSATMVDKSEANAKALPDLSFCKMFRRRKAKKTSTDPSALIR